MRVLALLFIAHVYPGVTITSFGSALAAAIVLGVIGARALSAVLMRNAEIASLPWSYLPAGALTLYLLGQIAVLASARRAAALPPVAALRGH